MPLINKFSSDVVYCTKTLQYSASLESILSNCVLGLSSKHFSLFRIKLFLALNVALNSLFLEVHLLSQHRQDINQGPLKCQKAF